MFTSLMHAELAATRQRDLIAAATTEHLARQGRSARRTQRRDSASSPVHRTWMRSATHRIIEVRP